MPSHIHLTIHVRSEHENKQDYHHRSTKYLTLQIRTQTVKPIPIDENDG